MDLREILADLKSDRRKKVILDTDAFNETDDQFAIAHCCLSRKIDLLSINAAPFHNQKSRDYADGMEKSYDEIIKILGLIDPDSRIPVYKGSRERMTRDSFVPSEAADNIIRTVAGSDELVYVLAIGAITNVASAIVKEPSIKDNMVVIWLGASDFEHGNLQEFNLSQDYTAAQTVLDSGVPFLLCPAWNVVFEITISSEDLDEFRGKSELSDYLREITCDCFRGEGWKKVLWDIAAPAVVDCPECAEIEIIPAPVFGDDRRYAFDAGRHEIMLLRKIDRDRAVAAAWDAILSV